LIRPALVFCLLAALTGCKPNEVSKTTAIIGAVLIDGNGGPPITDSVVVIAGSHIRSAGLRANVAIPADADKINGSGKFLIPGLIDLYCANNGRFDPGVTTTRLTAAGREFTGQITDPDVAKRKVTEFAAEGADFLFIRADDGRLNPVVADAVLDEARKTNLPVTASVTTLAQAEQLVKSGAGGFVRMITDTEDLDHAFLAKLRALNIVFTPLLTMTRSDARALRNTKRMAAAGVPIGVGSGSSGIQQELELLVEAGLSPLEVTTAATRNGAVALQKLAELGTIEAKKRANLVLLNANPLEDVRNFQKIDRVIVDGAYLTMPSLR
jgi:imidazolonepropionase-like amidohydrolase